MYKRKSSKNEYLANQTELEEKQMKKRILVLVMAAVVAFTFTQVNVALASEEDFADVQHEVIVSEEDISEEVSTIFSEEGLSTDFENDLIELEDDEVPFKDDDFLAMVTDDMELSAKSSSKNITITWDANGGVFGLDYPAPSVRTEEYIKGENIASQSSQWRPVREGDLWYVEEKWVIRTGYLLAGWTDQNGKEYDIYGNYSFTENVTLKAVWGKPITITFDFLDGKEDKDKEIHAQGEKFVLYFGYEEEGFVPTGWKDETGKIYKQWETVSFTKDTTLTAVWETKKNLSSSVVKIANKTYTGNALKPTPVVKLGNKTLTKNTDYTVSYKKINQ